MRSRVFLLFLVLGVFSAHAQLGDARRVLPVRSGLLPVTGIERPVQSDGTNFLVILGTPATASDSGSPRQMVLLGPDGTQLTDPKPVRHNFFSAGWMGHYLLVWGGNPRRYVRVSSEGELLDAGPRPMPIAAPVFGVAGDTAYLAIDDANLGVLLHPDGDFTPLGNLPDGRIITVASNGPDFAITYAAPTAVQRRLRIIDDRGETRLDRALEYGNYVRSDRNSYLLVPDIDDSGTPHRIYDREFRLIREVERSPNRALDPLGRRGYFSYTYLPPAATNLALIERPTPSYIADSVVVPVPFPGNPYDLQGNPRALLVLKSVNAMSSAYVVSKLSELPTAAPVELRGALDRERPVAATNAAGVSLVVWRESPAGEGRVYAARLSPAGTLLDARPLPIAEQPCRDLRTAVASDGTDFLVGWSGCTAAGATHVSAGGQTTPSLLRQRTAQPDNHTLSLAFDGETYLFSWSDSAVTTVVARVMPGGSAVLPPALLEGRNALLAPVDGGGVLMVYQERGLANVYSRRLSRELQPGPSSFLVTTASRPHSLTRVGDRLLLIAASNAFALDQEGSVRSQQSVAAPDPRVQCAEECTLVWKRWPSATGPAELVAAPLSADARIGATEVLFTYDEDFPMGEAVLLRGTATRPKLVLYTASDRENGGLQLFARTSSEKRRAVRP